MKVYILQTRGNVSIRDMPDDSVMELVSDWQTGDSAVITVTIDDAITHMARSHIVRIDVDEGDDQ